MTICCLFFEGIFPPWGTDPSVCDRAIMGVYDDHDFGWNDGNMREPDKQVSSYSEYVKHVIREVCYRIREVHG